MDDRCFDAVVLPHLDAGRRLARWLSGNADDAEDVVQEASLRAFRYFHTFTGGNGRAWFLRIVRHTWLATHLRRPIGAVDSFDEEQHSSARPSRDPEALAQQIDDERWIARAMERLPMRARDLLVLREVEGLSYRELSDAMGVPIGTVMSGLSRARRAFKGALTESAMASTTHTGRCDSRIPCAGAAV
jgi:RNA polymerase sigma-70 factor (ECF subfamily)